MAQVPNGTLHKFLTGETVTGDETPNATNINTAFELIRVAHNDTDTRAKDTNTKAEADAKFYSKTQLDAGQLDNRYFTETELSTGSLDTRYYTETELNNGQLDNRYYTEAELNNGQLDNRYYTEAEMDSVLAGITPDSRAFVTKSQLFIATEGQTLFTLTEGSYATGFDRIQVYIGGVKQYIGSGDFAETSATSFTLSEGVSASTKVEATWMEGIIAASATDEITALKADTTQRAINVKSSPYNANGDGATDDTTAVQSAINDASTLGGFVYFPPGTYIVNNVALKSGVSLIGAGNNATFIKRNGTSPIFHGEGTLDVNNTPTLFGITFRDLVIESYGTTTTDMMTIKCASNIIFENVTLAGTNCTLLSVWGLWDSRFVNFHVAGGGNSSLSLPAIMINGEKDGYKQSKEIFFVNLWMESYAYCGIQTSYTGIKPQYLIFDNVKMESFNCSYRHLDLTVNNLKISNFYVNSANVTDHPVWLSNCFGIYGDIQIQINNDSLASLNGLIKFVSCVDIDLVVLSPTPLAIITNIVTIDNPTELRNNIRIASSVRKFNGNNTKSQVIPFSNVIQNVDASTFDCSYYWNKDGRPSWGLGKPTLNGSNEEFYLSGSGNNFLTFRGLGGSFANGSRQVRFGAHAALDSAYNGNAMLLLGNYYVWVDADGKPRIKNGAPTSATDGSAINLGLSGTTAQRPASGLYVGLPYFDTTLGKPIWYNGSLWKDATGTTV